MRDVHEGHRHIVREMLPQIQHRVQDIPGKVGCIDFVPVGAENNVDRQPVLAARGALRVDRVHSGDGGVAEQVKERLRRGIQPPLILQIACPRLVHLPDMGIAKVAEQQIDQQDRNHRQHRDRHRRRAAAQAARPIDAPVGGRRFVCPRLPCLGQIFHVRIRIHAAHPAFLPPVCRAEYAFMLFSVFAIFVTLMRFSSVPAPPVRRQATARRAQPPVQS